MCIKEKCMYSCFPVATHSCKLPPYIIRSPRSCIYLDSVKNRKLLVLLTIGIIVLQPTKPKLARPQQRLELLARVQALSLLLFLLSLVLLLLPLCGGATWRDPNGCISVLRLETPPSIELDQSVFFDHTDGHEDHQHGYRQDRYHHTHIDACYGFPSDVSFLVFLFFCAVEVFGKVWLVGGAIRGCSILENIFQVMIDVSKNT